MDEELPLTQEILDEMRRREKKSMKERSLPVPEEFYNPAKKLCPRCNGTGLIHLKHGDYYWEEKECPDCHGKRFLDSM
jgi:excinuclease UvrABC ATPase subunit